MMSSHASRCHSGYKVDLDQIYHECTMDNHDFVWTIVDRNIPQLIKMSLPAASLAGVMRSEISLEMGPSDV